jgi:hypothetical protein
MSWWGACRRSKPDAVDNIEEEIHSECKEGACDGPTRLDWKRGLGKLKVCLLDDVGKRKR